MGRTSHATFKHSMPLPSFKLQDAVLLEAGGAFESLAPHLLAELEQLYKLRLAGAGAGAAAGGEAGSRGSPGRLLAPVPEVAEPAGPEAEGHHSDSEGGPTQPRRRVGSQLQPGRRPTAAALWLGDADLDEVGLPLGVALPPDALAGGSSFRDREETESEAAAQRLLRTLSKKLQQIEHLQSKAAAGAPLDSQQRAKVEQRPVILSAVAALESGMALDDVRSILRAAGREGEEELESCASGSAAPGSSSKAADGASAQQAKGRSKRSSQKAEAPPEATAAAEAAEAEAAALAAAIAAAAEADELESAEALLGSSPPASSLVPAFGAAGSVAAAAEQPRTPAAQVKSLVGFATTTAAAGPAAAAVQQAQPAQLGRTSSATKPKSAAKRKGEWLLNRRGGLITCSGTACMLLSLIGQQPHTAMWHAHDTMQALYPCSCEASWSSRQLAARWMPAAAPRRSARWRVLAAAVARRLHPPGAPSQPCLLWGPPPSKLSWTRRQRQLRFPAPASRRRARPPSHPRQRRRA